MIFRNVKCLINTREISEKFWNNVLITKENRVNYFYTIFGNAAMPILWCQYETSKIAVVMKRRIPSKWVKVENIPFVRVLRIHSTSTPSSNLSYFEFMIRLDLVSLTTWTFVYKKYAYSLTKTYLLRFFSSFVFECLSWCPKLLNYHFLC